MENCGKMNAIQDAMIETSSLCRDCIMQIFSENSKHDSSVDSTLKMLVSYFSDRSQVVAHLVSCEYSWDAEMILRSAFEASAKLWLICLSSQIDREHLVEEYWGLYAQVHNRKRSHRAGLAKSVFINSGDQHSVDIFEALEDERLFTHDNVNKRKRKEIEQKWSFTEIVKYLEKNHPPQVPMKYLSSVLHTYGNASHLLHTDTIALDMMLDRNIRDKDELLILKCAHTVRIWGDVVLLWYISCFALGKMYDVFVNCEKIDASYRNFFELSDPIREQFDLSQREFYTD